MILDRSFFKNVSKLAGATIIAQAIGIITVPIFSRLFSPDVVGQFYLLTSLVGIVGVFSTGRYEFAIMLPKEDKKAISLVYGSTLICLIVSVLSLFAIYLFRNSIVKMGDYDKIGDYLFFVPVFVFVAGFIKISTYWCNRKERFGLNAVITLVTSIVSKFGNILFGFWGFVSALTLIVINLVVQCIELLLRALAFRKDSKPIRKSENIAFKDIKSSLVEYKKFPLVDLWNGFLDQGSILIVPVVLSVFFTTSDVGLYSQAMQIVQLPIAIVAGAFGQVFFKKFTDVSSDDSSQVISESFATLAIFSFPIFTILGIFGESIFSWFLGEQWAISGLYAQILAPWCCFKMVFSPLSTFFEAKQKQDIFLYITMATLLTRVVSIVVGGLLGSCLLAVVLFGLTGLLINVLGIVILFKMSNTHLSDVMASSRVLISKIKAIVLKR